MNKIIHYCWFGNSEKPKLVKKCIASWEKHLPDYEIKEWNEQNFDLNECEFIKGAYADKNFAFVSDYVRANVLYKYGGIYLDTDVEVLKSFNPFLSNKVFLGFEEKNFVGTCVMGCEKESDFLKDYIGYYRSIKYFNDDGTKYHNTNVVYITKLLEDKGLIRNNEEQIVDGYIKIYPRSYFSPYDYINGISYIDSTSVAIHHFAQLWLPKRTRIKSEVKKYISKLIGGERIKKMREISQHKYSEDNK